MTNCSIKWLIWGKIEGLRGRLMVGQQTLDLFILVRIQAPQPVASYYNFLLLTQDGKYRILGYFPYFFILHVNPLEEEP